jgi:hypothetical protein
VKLTTHLHLEPRSRIRGAILPLPSTPSGCGAQLKHRDFTFTHNTENAILQLPEVQAIILLQWIQAIIILQWIEDKAPMN